MLNVPKDTTFAQEFAMSNEANDTASASAGEGEEIVSKSGSKHAYFLRGR